MTNLVINLASKLVTASGVIAIREQVAVYLVNIGGSDPAQLVLAITNGEDIIVECSDFALVGSDVVGTLDLTVHAALALFQPTDSPTWTRELYLTVYDKSLNALRVNDVVGITNCAYSASLPQPTVL